MLLALATGQRVQTLWHLDIEWLTCTDEAFCFVIPNRLKQTAGNRATPDLYLPKSSEAQTCLWRCLYAYLVRTEDIRHDTRLLVTMRAPHGHATRTTISRWMRCVLRKSGVNEQIYKAHSTRAAATSKAHMFIPLQQVMAAADWATASTFRNHYQKQVSGRGEFAKAVWQKV